MDRLDFANIFFAGPCNLACPRCIGRTPSLTRLPHNLDRFPLAGLDRFVALLKRHDLREVTLSGTNTDPLLYRPLRRLITLLQRRLPGVRLNLHSNGRLALRRLDLVNRCHRVTLSIPALDEPTYRACTGRRGVPDLAAVVRALKVPLKISILVTEQNRDQLPRLLDHLNGLGIRRVVLRHPAAQISPTPVLMPRTRVGSFAGQPVHTVGSLEVTEWIFPRSTLRCLSLFSDGSIGRAYDLCRGRPPSPIKRDRTCHVLEKTI